MLSLPWLGFSLSRFVFIVSCDLARAQRAIWPISVVQASLTLYGSFIIQHTETSTSFLPDQWVVWITFVVIIFVFYIQNVGLLGVFIVNCILLNSTGKQHGLWGSDSTKMLRIIKWIYQNLIIWLIYKTLFWIEKPKFVPLNWSSFGGYQCKYSQ